MLVIDSSAVIAMLFNEPEGAACAARLATSANRVISAANYVETGTVLAGRMKTTPRENALADLDAFLTAFDIDVVAVTQDQAIKALKARIQYGRGFGTSGGLNYGDTFAYALAKSHGAPLLFIGEDFAKTDIESAL